MVHYIKICGIHDEEDALRIIKQGANAIGVITGALHKTEDELPASKARSIFRRIPDSIYKVLVTHIEESETVLNLALLTGCNTIQIHSSMEMQEIERLRKWFTGTLIGVTHGNSPDLKDRFSTLSRSGLVDIILVDTKTSDRVGGTGLTHDWAVTAEVRQANPTAKLILAGGLTPENILDAVRVVQPFGVDVNSGVKSRFGRKDPGKVKQLIERATQYRF